MRRITSPSCALLVAVFSGCNNSPATTTPPTPVDKGPCIGSAITKGPWSMRATDSGASVFWETKDQGCVELGLTPEDGGDEVKVKGVANLTQVLGTYGVSEGIKDPDIAGPYYVNQVDLTGLPDSTCYEYRARQMGAADAAGRFCTMRASGKPYTFFAIGDTDPVLGHTVPIFKYTLPFKPDFIVHVGDLQYYSAVSETWNTWFQLMEPMMAAGAFFPAIGNHEAETPTEYADYYQRLFNQPSLDGTSQWFRYESGGLWFHAIDTEEPYDSGSPQYQWLLNSLQEVTSKPGFRFSVVYMHRNLYTLGDSAPQVDNRRALSPIFEANRVRLVLSGHMHGYERFEVGDITYVTTAGGGGVIGDVSANVPLYPDDDQYRVAFASAYHAMIFDVTPSDTATTYRGRAIDEHGTTIDDFTHTIDLN